MGDVNLEDLAKFIKTTDGDGTPKFDADAFLKANPGLFANAAAVNAPRDRSRSPVRPKSPAGASIGESLLAFVHKSRATETSNGNGHAASSADQLKALFASAAPKRVPSPPKTSASDRAVIMLMKVMQEMAPDRRAEVVIVLRQLAKALGENIDTENGLQSLVGKLAEQFGEDALVELVTSRAAPTKPKGESLTQLYDRMREQQAPPQQQPLGQHDLFAQLMSAQQQQPQYPPAPPPMMGPGALLGPPQSAMPGPPQGAMPGAPLAGMPPQMPPVGVQPVAPFDFMSRLVTNHRGPPELHVHPLFTLGADGDTPPTLKQLNEPIGCTYLMGDTPRFVICDTKANQVRIYADDAKATGGRPTGAVSLLQEAGKHKLSGPSAVVRSRCGTAFAVKDAFTIQMFSVTSGEHVCEVARSRSGRLFGLAAIFDKEANTEHLVTMCVRGPQDCEVQVYRVDPSAPGGNVLFKRHDYVRIMRQARHVDGGRIDSERGYSPFFMSASGRNIAITDLSELASSSTMSAAETSTVTVMDALSGRVLRVFGREGREPGCFSFVSGIRLDDFGNMLIGDAKNQRIQVPSALCATMSGVLQLFDTFGRFVTVVSNAQVFVTDIHVTPDYRIMIMQRHGRPLTLTYVGRLGNGPI